MTLNEINTMKERIRRSENYPEIYQNASLRLRELKIRPELAGYNILIQSICANRILGLEDDELYEFVETTTLIPHFSASNKDEAHIAKIWILESFDAIGLKLKPMEFIRTVEL